MTESTSEFLMLKNFYLEQIDAWKSGDKATVGRPLTSERYAREMREEIKRLSKLVQALQTP